jgi:hypothetical protein
MASDKLSTNPLDMWAVTPEEGFLDDTIAVFKDEGHAEQFRKLLIEKEEWGSGLVVVKVSVEIELVLEDI